MENKAPLFPGYLFMGTSIDHFPWKSVNGTRGISKAVTLDGVYRSINKHIIEGLQYRCDENDVFKALHYIDVGDRVKIESGPFADFICTVDQLKGDQRAWVLIDILQQQTKAEISLENVLKIN